MVRLSGELDLASEHALEALRVELLATAPARVVVDLRELQFVELTGLHWLMALHEGLAGRSRLELVRGPDCVHAALRLTGVDERFMFVAGDDID